MSFFAFISFRAAAHAVSMTKEELGMPPLVTLNRSLSVAKGLVKGLEILRSRSLH